MGECEKGEPRIFRYKVGDSIRMRYRDYLWEGREIRDIGIKITDIGMNNGTIGSQHYLFTFKNMN